MRRRALILRVHLLIGMPVAGLLVLLALSGAVLVFRGEIEDALHPAPVRERAGAPRVAAGALVDAAQRRHPDAAPTALVLPRRGDRPARVTMADPAGAPLVVLLDPYTGAVLGSHWEDRSPLHALWLLHAELYLGARGRLGVALIGAGLWAQAGSGLSLRWPLL